jgi:glutamate dehydrogenase (NAD(P)+)
VGAGGVHTPAGVDPVALTRYQQETGSVAGFRNADALRGEELFEVDCDVLAPCALSGVITPRNADRIRARMIVEGANGPTTPDADEMLRDRGVLIVPDIIANAGGVTVSYFEWVQDLQAFFWDEAEINGRLEQIMVRSFKDVAGEAESYKVDLRTGAQMLAIARVAEALMLRGIFP